jgi:excisionase family DNA binding protein
MRTPVEDRDYFTPAEAARELDVSVSTIWRWIESSKLRAYRVGARSIRIPKGTLAEVVRPARSGDLEVRFPVKGTLEVQFPLDPSRRGKFLELARQLRADIAKRRDGVPLPESWPEIRAAREERDREIDAWFKPK